MDIEANLRSYLKGQEPTGRYASFDYCFNYFQSHREDHSAGALVDGSNMEISCLQLGFDLASWGMLRGSSKLLQRSVKHLVPVVEVIVDTPPEVWGVDVDGYTDADCELLLETRDRLRSAFPEGASNTLVTKIMLGVFGSVPAFDTFFKKGFHVSALNLNTFCASGSSTRTMPRSLIATE